jgi:glutaredoxin-like YruB-family protein
MNEDKKQKNVEIYSTPTCHFCHMAKDFFDENGIEYTDYNVLTDIEKRQEMMEKSGQGGVPVIVIGDRIFVGFDQTAISEALGI